MEYKHSLLLVVSGMDLVFGFVELAPDIFIKLDNIGHNSYTGINFNEDALYNIICFDLLISLMYRKYKMY